MKQSSGKASVGYGNGHGHGHSTQRRHDPPDSTLSSYLSSYPRPAAMCHHRRLYQLAVLLVAYSLCMHGPNPHCLLSGWSSSCSSPVWYVSGAVVMSTVMGGLDGINDELVTQSLLAYKLQKPELNFQTQSTDSTSSLDGVYNNDYDFAVTTHAVGSILQQTERPDIVLLPLQATAIAITYRIDTLANVDVPIVLTRAVLARIFRGNITNWNDAHIQITNPSLTLPDLNITVVVRVDSAPVNEVLTTALCKFESEFCPAIGGMPSLTPAWTYSRYARSIQQTGNFHAVESVFATNGGITYAPLSECIQNNSPVASIINKAGLAVAPDARSVNFALIELAGSDSSADANYDLTDATSGGAYPICLTGYLAVSKSLEISTCTLKAANIGFWAWYYTSAGVKTLGTDLGYVIMPDVIITERAILTTLQNGITCGGNAISVDSNSQIAIQITGPPLITSTFKMVDAFYSDLDAVADYSFRSTNSQAAYAQILQREIDAAFVVPAFISEDQLLADVMVNEKVVVVPTFVVGIKPVYHFPAGVLPGDAPILSSNTVARIMTGNVTSWLDPTITRFNPLLAARFGHIDPTIRVVVSCIPINVFNTPVGDIAALALNTSTVFKQAIPGLKLPFDWCSVAHIQWNFIKATNEDMIPGVVNQTPGGFGFTFDTDYVIDPTTDVVIRTSNSSYINSSPQTQLACIQDTFNKDTLVFKIQSSGNPGCWPYTQTMGFVVPSTYANTACTRANLTLSYIKWILAANFLDIALGRAGVTRITSLTEEYNAVIAKLYSTTCDGETLLITLPIEWKVGTGVMVFGFLFAMLGGVACLVTLVTIIKFRQRTVFKSASVSFLLTTLVGIMILFSAAVMMIQNPHDDVCGAMAWTVDLGFSIAFIPLFAKTWRIYRIFGRKALKVIKISNNKLLSGVTALVLLDVIFLSVWQGVSPMKAITYSLLQGNRIHEYAHCYAESSGSIFLTVLVVMKAALLIFGSIMALSTRRVATTFNESQSIAWAIYNVVFSVCIIVPIAVFTSAIGDTLILLMVFLCLWIAAFTWAIMFLPKMLALMTPEGSDNFSEHSSMQRESSGGFSFLSATMMSKEILTKYVVALESQLKSAKERLMRFNAGTKTSAGGSVIGKSSLGGGGGNNVSHIGGRKSSFNNSHLSNLEDTTGSARPSAQQGNFVSGGSSPGGLGFRTGPSTGLVQRKYQSLAQSSLSTISSTSVNTAPTVSPPPPQHQKTNSIGGHVSPSTSHARIAEAPAGVSSSPALTQRSVNSVDVTENTLLLPGATNSSMVSGTSSTALSSSSSSGSTIYVPSSLPVGPGIPSAQVSALSSPSASPAAMTRPAGAAGVRRPSVSAGGPGPVPVPPASLPSPPQTR